jgi:hypothetical protein
VWLVLNYPDMAFLDQLHGLGRRGSQESTGVARAKLTIILVENAQKGIQSPNLILIKSTIKGVIVLL